MAVMCSPRERSCLARTESGDAQEKELSSEPSASHSKPSLKDTEDQPKTGVLPKRYYAKAPSRLWLASIGIKLAGIERYLSRRLAQVKFPADKRELSHKQQLHRYSGGVHASEFKLASLPLSPWIFTPHARRPTIWVQKYALWPWPSSLYE